MPSWPELPPVLGLTQPPNYTKPLQLRGRVGGFNIHPNCSEDWVIHWKFLWRCNLDSKVFCVRSFKLLQNASISLPKAKRDRRMILVFEEIFLRAHCAREDEGSQPRRILSSPIDLSSMGSTSSSPSFLHYLLLPLMVSLLKHWRLLLLCRFLNISLSFELHQ